MNLDRYLALAYVAPDSDPDRAKLKIGKPRLQAAGRLSEPQVQKESRSRGGKFSLFDALVESARATPSAHSYVSSS